MKVEYLVLIDSKEEFCKSTQTLNNLIEAYDGITIQGNSIKFKGCTFSFFVQLGEPDNTSHRFFHIKIENEDDKQFGDYQTFLKFLRTILSKISGQPVEVLTDDLSSARCIEAYPIIHHLENKMRKLITKFMLTNIGLGWSKDSTPKEVVDSIKSTKPKETNFLHEVDFIQLSKFLFNSYASLDSKKVIEKIKEAKSVQDLDLEELREFVPQSNWERYFATIVDCSNEFLQKRWERLYELRNKVAHNRFIAQDELDELKVLSSEVDDKLQAALDNLDKIYISNEKKEEVAENVALNRDELYREFLEAWNVLLDVMHRVAVLISTEDNRNKIGNGKNWRGMVNVLIANDCVSKDFKQQMQEIAQFRNTLVHHPDVIFTHDSIIERVKILIELYDHLSSILDKL